MVSNKKFRWDQVLSCPEMSYQLSTAWYYQIQPFSCKLARNRNQPYRSSWPANFNLDGMAVAKPFDWRKIELTKIENFFRSIIRIALVSVMNHEIEKSWRCCDLDVSQVVAGERTKLISFTQVTPCSLLNVLQKVASVEVLQLAWRLKSPS